MALRCSVILDEVDILCNDEEFEAAFQSIINSSPVTTQYLFVTATLPVDIYNKIVEILPDCEVIMGPGIHRTSPHLEEVGLKLYYSPSVIWQWIHYCYLIQAQEDSLLCMYIFLDAFGLYHS